MTEMRARLVDKDGNPLGTASNPLKISGDVGGGVPDGGTTGQVLQKKSDADQDVEWGDGSGSSTAWGSITGTLSDQTDLGNVLDGKIADRCHIRKPERQRRCRNDVRDRLCR